MYYLTINSKSIGFYLHPFKIWLATTVVFFWSGSVGFLLAGRKSVGMGLLENLIWIPLWVPGFSFCSRILVDGDTTFSSLAVSVYHSRKLSLRTCSRIIAHGRLPRRKWRGRISSRSAKDIEAVSLRLWIEYHSRHVICIYGLIRWKYVLGVLGVSFPSRWCL